VTAMFNNGHHPPSGQASGQRPLGRGIVDPYHTRLFSLATHTFVLFSANPC
jgi:hypothetical protein